MKDFSKYIKGFYHLSEAWYGEVNLRNSKYIDEVMLGYYAKEGGTGGEFGIRWKELGGKSIPQLQAFYDAWGVLASMPEFIYEIGELDDKNIQPKEFCAILLRLGFQDLTQRADPYTGSDERKESRETMLENTLSALVDGVESDVLGAELKTHIDNANKLLGRK